MTSTSECADAIWTVLTAASFLQWILFVSFLLLVWYLRRVSISKTHPFDIRDTLLDPITRRASIASCILWIMAIMAVYICLDRNSDGKDVDNLVLGVLGIFVVGRVAGSGIEIYRKRMDAQGMDVSSVRVPSSADSTKVVDHRIRKD